MSNPSFIITRFTHGSAGKFLSSILQTSDRVDHWSALVQDNKSNHKIFNDLMLQYTSRSFPQDHSTHLRVEPMVPYNVDLYSVGYPRGDDVTLDQYLTYAYNKNDLRLINAINNSLTINLIFHKPQLPLFCNGSDVITITVTSDREKDWLYKTLWSKQFVEKDNNIYYLPNDPNYCSFYSLVPVLTYNNPYCFSKDNKDELYNKYVVNDHTNSWYFDPDKFNKHDACQQLNNRFVKLEEILLLDKFLSVVLDIFDFYNLGDPDIDLITQMHSIWSERQFSYDL